MKKAFDQTVRDIKREVNKKVLKVPSVEQKVLDATSNEPWGPHGSLLADIAQASRNYHEYQMIMAVMWKRINDTGRNWRHVYKALTVLEYLVAHGSERVIDEIREHAYQISTLSDFQYIDSSGRDQGSNVRKKSQSLVVLVNDKERIQEVRQKAAANREKYRNTSAGSMYRPSSYSSTGGNGDRYDDDRYGSRDEDRNGYGREKEWGSRDDGRYGDSYGRDGDRYSRDGEERYSRDGYRDDDYRGRSRSTDDYQYGSRSRSSDRDGDRPYEDDGQYSSRGSGAKADDRSQDGSIAGRRLDRKFSEQNLGAPPSYEEALGDVRSPVHSERDGEASAAPAPKSLAPPVNVGSSQANITPAAPAAPLQPPAPAPAPAPAAANEEVDAFDEFDPRGSFSAASNGAEVDLLGSLSDSFSSNALAIVPTTSATTTSDADAFLNSGSGPSFVATSSASAASSQPFEDPFGDGPFKAVASTGGILTQPENIASTSSFHLGTDRSSEPPQPVFQEFGDTFSGMTYVQSNASDVQLPSGNPQYSHQELSTVDQDTDILADILPPSGPPPPITSQTAFPLPTDQHASQTGFPGQFGYHSPQAGFPAQTSQPLSLTGFPAQLGQQSQTGFSVQSSQPSSLIGFPAQAGQSTSQAGFPPQAGQPALQTGFPPQASQPALQTGFPSQMDPLSQASFPSPGAPPAQPNANFYGSFHPQSGYVAPAGPHMTPQVPTGPTAQHNPTNFLPQSGSATPVASQVSLQIPQPRPSSPMASQPALTGSTGSLAIVPQPAKEKKFETKSSVWADTLNRGLVNLNISGPKTNPLADIGVDFDAINRREKRMEKPTAAPVVSNITMGKAMGSGSGIGRAGAGALRPSSNPMVGSGMGMGVGGGSGMGMGGYGGANQPMGGVGMRMNMGMGMNMGIGQGVQMQPPTGFPPGSNMPGGYNPMMGAGGYGQQPPPYPYGGGYR